jgi:hypothetical protein
LKGICILNAPGKILKIKFQVKALALVFSVLSLSWFFEGVRQIKTGVTFGHCVLLLSATVLTLALLWIQAFWIYLEEKSKGTLKKTVVHFDRLEQWLKQDRQTKESPQESVMDDGGNCGRGS